MLVYAFIYRCYLTEKTYEIIENEEQIQWYLDSFQKNKDIFHICNTPNTKKAYLVVQKNVLYKLKLTNPKCRGDLVSETIERIDYYIAL